MTMINPPDVASVPLNRRKRTASCGLRQRAWWVIRRREVFTLADLLDVVANGSERDAKSNLRKWLKALAGCGILNVDKKLVPGVALTSPGFLRYRLVINNGRLAPVWRAATNEVYDPNKRTCYPIVKEISDA
ncbi:hypothetical protein [Janthinobacterium aquaticum]|uniref:hypothetical protein n=1 Tax=Janthinobacterium sp. FT58W TaxID=2654254 RepID=UPI0012642A4A|nr:hypothetical protein [Janthinobacterium sp. FT58W]KAB8037384.1 hypothetical protein GCM43_23540 [Janthinobacterium sp. FT58W]